MLAQFIVILIGGVAHFETEHPGADEVDPFDYLAEAGRGWGV